MAAKGPPLQYEVANDKQLEDYLAGPGLKVVEIYSEWCGPCKSVLPTFKRIRLDKEEESCLLFLTVQAETCEFLQDAKDHRGKSEPLFLLFRNGTCKKDHKIVGANTPHLGGLILELTPNSPDQDEPEGRHQWGSKCDRLSMMCEMQSNPIFVARKERLKNAK